jgi:hypothetical protein
MYYFRLQRTDGSPAGPPTCVVVTDTEHAQHPLGGGRDLVALPPVEPRAPVDQPPALVVTDGQRP